MKGKPQQGFGKYDRTLDRSPQNRRLDSIARLLNTKDEVCTALCFNNGRILLANNSAKVTDLQKEYISFFRACLVHGPEYLKTEKFQTQYKRLLTKSIIETARPGKHLKEAINAVEALHVKKQKLTPKRKEILEEIATNFKEFYRSDLVQVVSDYLDHKTDLSAIYNFYQEKLKHDAELVQKRLSIDIDKVVHALTSNDANAFANDIKDAFLRPLLFIGQDTPKLHAEMKILDYLYVTRQLNLNAEQDRDTETIYVGISKLCCLGCAATVQALNEHIIEQFEAEDMDNLEFHAAEAATTTPRQHHSATAAPVTPPRQMIPPAKPHKSPIQTRGFHLSSFPRWEEPEFLSLISDKYHKALTEFSGVIKTKHLPGFSPSPAAKIRPLSTDSDDDYNPRRHSPPPPLPAFSADDKKSTAAVSHPARSAPEVTSTAEMPESKAVSTGAQRIELWNRKAYISKPKGMHTPAAKSIKSTPSTVAHKPQNSPQTLPRTSEAHASPHAMQRRELSFAESEPSQKPSAKPAPKAKTPGGKQATHSIQQPKSFKEQELEKKPQVAAAVTKKIPGSELAPTKSRKSGKDHGMQSRESSFAERELAKKSQAKPTPKGKTPGGKHASQGMQSRESSFAERDLATQPATIAARKSVPKGKGKGERWTKVVSKKNAKGQQK